jgi:hypothetical protein
MAFKTATVNSSKVASSESNFPTYIDLTRVKGSAMTQAEANSVRVYSDESKTTELAREIVSVSEMHVKISSLTTTTTIYVDYDGVRSDYAATDTYGRNAVWSDYAAVYHFNEDPSGSAPQIIDSTGNENGGTTVGSMTSGDLISAKIGEGLDLDSNDGVQVADASNLKPTSALTFSAWVYFNNNGVLNGITEKQRDSAWGGWRQGDNTFLWRTHVGGSLRTATSSTTTSTNTWYHYVGTAEANAVRLYLQGSPDGSATGTFSTIGTATSPWKIGMLGRTSANELFMNGRIDEVRFRPSALSANWITTEYNNQSDEAGFWGTWTDAGGAVASTGFQLWWA